MLVRGRSENDHRHEVDEVERTQVNGAWRCWNGMENVRPK